MLKILLIIPSSASQKITHYFYFILLYHQLLLLYYYLSLIISGIDHDIRKHGLDTYYAIAGLAEALWLVQTSFSQGKNESSFLQKGSNKQKCQCDI